MVESLVVCGKNGKEIGRPNDDRPVDETDEACMVRFSGGGLT